MVFWAALKKALVERLGDHFIIMPYATLTHITKTGGKDDDVVDADFEEVK